MEWRKYKKGKGENLKKGEKGERGQTHRFARTAQSSSQSIAARAAPAQKSSSLISFGKEEADGKSIQQEDS